MPWSNWIELKFKGDGTLDRSRLSKIPTSPGVYAIGMRKRTGGHVILYVGRSLHLRVRLNRHLTGHGNSVIATQLLLNQKSPTAPWALSSLTVAVFPTKEPKIVESVLIDSKDRPICNLVRARLPSGLSESAVFRSRLDRQ